MSATIDMRRKRAQQALDAAGYTGEEAEVRDEEVRKPKRRGVKKYMPADDDDLRVIPPEPVS